MGKHKPPITNCTPSSGKGKQKPTKITTSPVPQEQDWVICSPVGTPSRGWKDELTWDLDGVRALRELLTQWISLGVTASDIGGFLESVLYNRDEHLSGRLTRMVNNHETHTEIALDLLKHYQIRDDAGQPLWDLKGSQLESEPSQTPKRDTWYQVPAPKPLRTFKKPYFMHDVDPIPDIEDASERPSGTACWSFNISEDLTMLTIAERRALMANTGALPPSFAAEICDSAPAPKQEERMIMSGGSRGSYSSSDYGD
ncbi:hypothetical protein N7504_009441 [Penicillium tannophilum]|nr:hypothetical protein N7504_009441 [Penicillium tannophilum]